MNPDGTYKNPAFGLYQAMVPAPNQNFLSPTQQPMNNYFRAAEPDQPHNTQASVARRLQPLGELPLLRSRQRQQIPRVVAGRLDVRLARSAVRGPARRGACAVQLVGDRHVDEGDERHHASSTRRFRATAPISATRARTWSTTCRRRSGCRRTWTTSARRGSSASCPQNNHQLVPGHGRHGRRRHLGDDLPGAVEPHEHARVAYLARRRRRAVGPAHQPGRRREHGDVQLRQHLHPRGRHHERVSGAANRLEPGRVHAGHADVGVDRRRTTASTSATTTSGRSCRTPGARRGT